jgi:O-acetyl-ADP-ribose deacetylase (regulator of RNase III)/predicted RNA-binding Zn-ribbon protein involved in translation (DUF1610 family)
MRSSQRCEARLAGNRTPVQVCPRGCGFRELARRDLIARTKWLGRAGVRVSFVFEASNCPKCGVRLVRRCARCKEEILAPVADRCQSCGLPQPWAFERREAAERTSIRLWRPEPNVPEAKRKVNDPARELYTARDRGDLWVIDGNIARLAVDAVVSNDDVDGQMWAEVARAIKLAAGEGVELLAQARKPYALGQAWHTPAGLLKDVQGIIHVASMTRNGESTIRSVNESLLAAYRLARSRKYESIGIGAIGSGPAAIPISEWLRAFAEVSVGYLADDTVWKEGDKPLSVVLVLFEPADFDADVERLRRVISTAWHQLGAPASGRPFKDLDGPFRSRAHRLGSRVRRLASSRKEVSSPSRTTHG